jgi:hypothetical protein
MYWFLIILKKYTCKTVLFDWIKIKNTSPKGKQQKFSFPNFRNIQPFQNLKTEIVFCFPKSIHPFFFPPQNRLISSLLLKIDSQNVSVGYALKSQLQEVRRS